MRPTYREHINRQQPTLNNTTMGNYVISIGRELGSGGKAIGQIMADKLGIKIYDRSLIDLASKQSGISTDIIKNADEVPRKNALGAMFRAVTIPFMSLDSFYSNTINDQSLFKVQSEIINKLSESENCIIVGRCSDYLLRNHPRHLNIFIRADKDDKIKFVCDREIIGRETAENMIKKVDKQRAAYHDFYSETKWGDSKAYDICINSSILGREATAEFLVEYAKKALKIE